MLFGLRLPEFQYESLGEPGQAVKHSDHGVYSKLLSFWREAVIICLCILCVILTAHTFFEPYNKQHHMRVQDYNITSEDTRWRQFQWHTGIYSSVDPVNDEAINAAWDRIVPAHGFVAVDHEWAVAHNLPASMSFPSDSTKGVYIIDAYHQIHCITIIRKTLLEISAGRIPSVPIQHSWHCFDSLLQYVMCGTSGDTLLYTWGRNETGDGQLRRCIDWNSRKKWAKENTACYKDGDRPIPLYDHFNHCENDDDGIRVLGMW